MSNNEFYIGWQPNAPAGLSKFIKRYLFGLLIFIISLGAILTLSQKKFATGRFEFGKMTEVKGVYFNDPVPMLKTDHGTYLLVGYGKHGVEPDLSLNGRIVILKGTLIYNGGKTLLQIDKNNDPLVKVDSISAIRPVIKNLGTYKVKGEIVDPKCYFGVMKPGEGKPHRDCAIRCILGGIPPVMHVQDIAGESNYYIIVGPNGEKMNREVQDYVAEPTEIEARLVQFDDWIIMYVNDAEPVKRISYLSSIEIMACGPVSYCSNAQPNK
jgi:hypothetical protein